MLFKRFKSSDGSIKCVSNDAGHSARIGSDWKSIPEFLWTECYANGCVSEDMINDLIRSEMPEPVKKMMKGVATRNSQIRETIKKWIDNNELDKFGANNVPKATLLTKELGFRVSSALRDDIWYRLQEGDK